MRKRDVVLRRGYMLSGTEREPYPICDEFRVLHSRVGKLHEVTNKKNDHPQLNSMSDGAGMGKTNSLVLPKPVPRTKPIVISVMLQPLSQR